MLVLIGVPEMIALVLIVAGASAVVCSWCWWRRLQRMVQAFGVREEQLGRRIADLVARQEEGTSQAATELAARVGEVNEVVRGFKHQARNYLRPMKDVLTRMRQQIATHSGDNEVLLTMLGDGLRDLETYDWRLTRLIENLALVSQLDTPGEQMILKQVKLDSLVDDVIRDFQPLADRKGIELSCVVPIEGLPVISANGAGLREAICNLVDNAIKYTPDGGHVDIVLAVDRARQVILVQVKDNGPGIPKEDLEAIFQRGYQVETTRERRPEGGQGLGLYIVKLIANKHGGHVKVESLVGEGSTFSLVLPIART